MADPFSITAGVLTLMPQVKEGFVLVKDVFVTDRKSRFYEGRVELQRTLFQAWEDCWTDSRGGPDKNFRDFAIVKPLSAKSTLQQLVLLLRTFTDPEKLKVKYGLAVEKPGALQRFDDLVVEMKYVSSYLYTISNNFSAKDAAMLEENQARHMDLFRKIRFTLSGSDKEIEDLIWRLDEFNRNLRILTTRTIGETANRRLFELAVKDIMGDVDHTRRLAEAATYEAKQSIDEEAKEKYDDLAKFGNFSLAIKFATAEMSRRKIFSRTDFSFDSPYELNPHATLARLFDYPTKYQSRLVLIEWVTLSRSSSIRENLDAMKITWYVLHAEKPEKLLLPATIGLIYEETEPRKIGIVFQLPPHIRGNLPTKPVVRRDGWMGPRVVRSPKAIAAQRMPITLRQLIQKKEIKGIDLGIRFQLAKRLLDAIHLMHTAGWIHTNIRPDNILFFPSASRSSGDPDPDALDYTRPLLVGFHDARLQVTFTPDVPPHQRNPHQPEGLKPILKNAPNRPQPRDVVIDCYQHPERRLGATNGGGASGRGAGGGGAGGGGGGPFRRQYDLYSVGCVLLELGLWETLDGAAGREVAARACRVGEAAREEDVWMDAETVRKLAKGLDVITGSIYAEVTRKCLSLSPVTGDIVEFERGLAATLAQIAA